MKARLSVKRMFWAAAGALAACLAGCVSGSGVVVSDVELPEEANKGEMTVADLLANGEHEAAERLARVCMEGGLHPFPYANAVVSGDMGADLAASHRQFARSSEADRTMHRLNLCSVLLLEGKKEEAHREMLEAMKELEELFDPESQALKLTHGEREKFFKGDGYERATLYAFLALSFMDRGDFANALKCVQRGILADSDSERAEHRADYALLPYIGYVAASKSGANWRQEAQNYDRLVKELTGVAPSERKLPAELLVVWVGRGSDRTLGGEFDEIRYVRKGSSRGALDAVQVKVGGVTHASFPDLADLTFQATTRGRRVMDNVLDRKATAKRGLAASANVLLAFGAGCFEAGAASGNVGFATVMFSVGGLCVGLGCPTHLVGMAINAQADDRCWQTLPARLVVVPLYAPRQRMDLDIMGYRRLDNVLNKKAPVDFSAATSGGIPVAHLSLLADRAEVERVVWDGIVRPAEEISARTKESFFADKVELTKEGDR